MKAYVDDLLVKSKKQERCRGFERSFQRTTTIQNEAQPNKMWLQSTVKRVFLDFVVFERGIEANFEKVQAIIDIEPPRNINEVRKLVGRIATINRFVSRLTDKCLLFFPFLQKVHDWDEE